MRRNNFAVATLLAGVICLPTMGQNASVPKRSNAAGKEASLPGDSEVGKLVHRLQEELSLSQEQQGNVGKLISDYCRKVQEQTRALVFKNIGELRRLGKRTEALRRNGDSWLSFGMTKESFLTQLQREKLMGKEQIELYCKDAMSGIAALLTAEQKAKFQQAESTGVWILRFANLWEIEQRSERLNQELTLSPAQQEKVNLLVADYRERVFEHTTAPRDEKVKAQFADLNAKMRDARLGGDKERFQRLSARWRELSGCDGGDVAYEKLVSGIDAVLTPKQRTQFHQMSSDLLNWLPESGALFPQAAWLRAHPELFARAVQSLKLPSERRSAIDPLLATAKAGTSATSKPDGAGAGAYEKVMAELSPGEQALVKAWDPAILAAHPRG